MPNTTPTLGFVLHDVARLMRKRFEQRARAHGFSLTRAQWQVLARLAMHEGIHQGGLADNLELEPITLVRILDKLEAAGLVERRRHERDRRIWLLHLTEKAHPLLVEMRAIGEATRFEALAGVAGPERDLLHAILTTMRTNLIEACNSPVADKETSHG